MSDDQGRNQSKGRQAAPRPGEWAMHSVININVTCAMQVTSVIHANTCTNTKDRQLETISESNMIWSQTTSCKVLEFRGNDETNLIVSFSKFFFFYQRPKTNAKQTVWFHPCKIICLDQFIKTYCCLLLHIFFFNFLTIITYVTHFTTFYWSWFFLNLTLADTFMLITCRFLTRTFKWPPEGRSVVDFYR